MQASVILAIVQQKWYLITFTPAYIRSHCSGRILVAVLVLFIHQGLHLINWQYVNSQESEGLASGHVRAIELVQLCHYYPLKLHNFVLTGDFRFEMLAPEGTHDHFFCIIVWLAQKESTMMPSSSVMQRLFEALYNSVINGINGI